MKVYLIYSQDPYEQYPNLLKIVDSIEKVEKEIKLLAKKDRIEHHDEEFMAIYGQMNPLDLVDFFKMRIDIGKKKKNVFFSISNYDALPYHLSEIAKTFSNHPAYRKVIKKILLEWLIKGDWSIQFEGNRFFRRGR